MTPAELDALEELEAKATKGPWEARRSRLGGSLVETIDGTIATVKHTDADADNAALVAAMRNALPALIAAARRVGEVESKLAQYRVAMDRLLHGRDVLGETMAQFTAATDRADALEAALQALHEVVDDNENYIDDTIARREVVAALKVAEAAISAARGK